MPETLDFMSVSSIFIQSGFTDSGRFKASSAKKFTDANLFMSRFSDNPCNTVLIHSIESKGDMCEKVFLSDILRRSNILWLSYVLLRQTFK